MYVRVYICYVSKCVDWILIGSLKYNKLCGTSTFTDYIYNYQDLQQIFM